MGTKMTRSVTLFIIIFILSQCSLSWAIKPLRGGEAEAPPEEILEIIEKEKEMKEEVIQRRREKELERSPKEIAAKKPVPAPETISKAPPITPIITALIILLVAFYIYRKR